ncbi:MFS transporter [Nocardioides sp. YJ-D4]
MSAPVEVREPGTSPRGLGRLLASTGVSMIGQGAATAAVPLLAASLTRDPLLVSLVVAASYAAWLVVGLPAGALVDRWPRRQTMVIADLVRVVLLALVAAGVLVEWLPIWGLIAVVFMIACASCFFDPAAQAAIPVLATREPAALAKANGHLWTLDIFGRSLVGPPLGAALFASAAVLPFALNSVTFLVSALLLVGLSGLGRAEHPDGAQPVHHAVRDGVLYLVRHPGLRLLTFGIGTYNFGYNIAFAILVLFAQDTLGLRDQGFGILLAMLAVGGAVGGWLGPRVHRVLSAASTYSLALAVQGIAWLVVVTTQNVYASGAALAVVGLASTVVSVVGGTARQTLTPDHLLGRITAGTRVVGVGVAALGAVVGGAVASAVSLDAALLLACVVLVAGAVAFLPAARARRV